MTICIFLLQRNLCLQCNILCSTVGPFHALANIGSPSCWIYLQCCNISYCWFKLNVAFCCVHNKKHTSVFEKSINKTGGRLVGKCWIQNFTAGHQNSWGLAHMIATFLQISQTYGILDLIYSSRLVYCIMLLQKEYAIN